MGRRLRRAAIAGAAAAGVHLAPSVVSLGQWLPLRVAPGGWCRWRGAAGRDAVALTFDDGPAPDTVVLLDRLDELGLVATFFCLGERVARFPDVVAEIARRGHQIETHGHRHDHHFVRGPGWVRRDLGAALDALAACDVHPRWFRPPYGQTTTGTLVAARSRGLGVALWSAWGREWASRDAAAVAERVVRGLEPGAVVLLHDSDAFSPAGSARRAREALGRVAEALEQRGLKALTLDAVVAPAA